MILCVPLLFWKYSVIIILMGIKVLFFILLLLLLIIIIIIIRTRKFNIRPF